MINSPVDLDAGEVAEGELYGDEPAGSIGRCRGARNRHRRSPRSVGVPEVGRDRDDRVRADLLGVAREVERVLDRQRADVDRHADAPGATAFTAASAKRLRSAMVRFSDSPLWCGHEIAVPLVRTWKSSSFSKVARSGLKSSFSGVTGLCMTPLSLIGICSVPAVKESDGGCPNCRLPALRAGVALDCLRPVRAKRILSPVPSNKHQGRIPVLPKGYDAGWRPIAPSVALAVVAATGIAAAGTRAHVGVSDQFRAQPVSCGRELRKLPEGRT